MVSLGSSSAEDEQMGREEPEGLLGSLGGQHWDGGEAPFDRAH